MKKIYTLIPATGNLCPATGYPLQFTNEPTLMKKILSPVMIVLVLLLISAQIAIAQTVGPNYALTGTDVSGIGTITWTNPGNVNANDNIYATAAAGTSHYLQGTNLNFSIPNNAVILGIQATIGRRRNGGNNGTITDNVVRLIKGGTVTGSNLAAGGNWGTAEAATNYGGAANLWGTTWTPADINAANFGVALSVIVGGNRTAQVDYMRITVTYVIPAAEPTTQASNVTFSAVTTTQMTIGWTPGNGSNRIVLVKSGSAVNSDPVDLTGYTANTIFGSGTQIGTGNYVVYNGTGNSVILTGLAVNTTYYVAVYEFNGSGGTQNYLTTNPATGNQLTPSASGDYRSVASGNWGTLATWERFNGTAWVTPTAGEGTPASGSGTITIRNGNTVTVAANVTVDQVIVEAGGQVTISSNFTMTIANGAGTDMSVSGTVLTNSTGGSGGFTINAGASLVFNTGGTLNYNVNGDVIPTATWSTGSTCLVTGIVGTACTGLNQAFSNLTWNCTAQTVAVGLGNANQTIGGNLDIQTTNTGSLIYLNAAGGGAARTLTLAGNFNLSAGTFNLSLTGCTRVINFNVAGNFTMSGGTFTRAGSGTHTVTFNKSGTQVYTKSGGTIASVPINFTVNSGSTFDMGNSILNGSTGTFTLSSGAGIITSNSGGLASTGATGSIQVGGTRTFNAAANYTYNGTSAQVTGTGVTGANNLTIDNSAGITLSNILTTVTGTLLINTGKLLTIETGKRLTVSGTFTNNAGIGGLVIKSDASGSGSLLENNGVSATVESYISGGKWHFISAPVSGAVSGIFTGKYLQTFTESTNEYTDIILTTEPLTPMKGFALWGDASGFTAQYTGPLNTGSKSIGLTRTTAGTNSGWNLVGNPYPSSIDWDAASGWTKTNINGPIYIENNGGWATYTTGSGTGGGTRYIAPGQGFMVSVGAVGAGTLGMNNNVRVHNATTFFKSTNAFSFVRLEVSGNGYSDEAIVRFMPDVTNEFDGQYDAMKLFGYIDESAQIYTLGSIPMTINSLIPETSEVPLGIQAKTAGTYTIAATELVDIPVVALEDTKTGIFTDLLTGGPYTFNMEAGEDEVRFMLHFGTTSVPDPESATINIYSYQKAVYIDLKDQVKGDIFIFNTAGQLVNKAPASKGINEIKLLKTGIYMVKVVTANSTVVKKVWIE
jgi:hypothetical protein